MAGKFEAPRKKGRIVWIVLPLLLLLLAVGCLALTLSGEAEKTTEGTLPSFTAPVEVSQMPSTEVTETTEPTVGVTASASIAVQGDLLMHATFFQQKYNSACRVGAGEYDFSSIFRYLTSYTESADYAVANLETTLGGDEFPYQGNPTFNCPDPILDAVKGAGYDLLLTANNHSYDTLMTGIDRTLEKTREAGVDTLGTRLNGEEDRFVVKEINGIRIGMVCYTYTMTMSGGKPKLNDNSPVAKPEQINYFTYQNLPGFYSEVEAIMEAMKQQGAEASMLYIHWGTEYEIEENETQRKIAQKMCDLGFDVIVGGHPHVVQPMALLESTTDPDHRTVCIYSLGNAVSNQRRHLMRLKTGHTEDGALLSVTFEKRSDGTVKVADCDVLPTWVHLYENSEGKNEYNILPLDVQKREQWAEIFGVSEEVCQELYNSYDRTMAIVGEGLEACRTYLSPK